MSDRTPHVRACTPHTPLFAAIAPVFMVKTRMQLMGEVSGAAGGVVATTRAIYKEGGLRAFYRVSAHPERCSA